MIFTRRAAVLGVSFGLMCLLCSLPLLADAHHCVRYGFRAGDSLVYRVHSFDTLDFDTRIIRERVELVSYVCDHVTESGNQLLRVTLESVEIREKNADGSSSGNDSTFRTRSPWLGRTAYIILDSSGKRILARQGDTARATVSPGGAFQPTLLLLGVDTLCHSSNVLRSWVITTTDTLAENAWPPPIVRSTYSCGMIDTVMNNRQHTAIRYAQTGQGSFKNITGDVGVVLRSVLDGYGTVVIDGDNSLPLSGESKIRIKVTVLMESSSTKGLVRHATSFERIYMSQR